MKKLSRLLAVILSLALAAALAACSGGGAQTPTEAPQSEAETKEETTAAETEETTEEAAAAIQSGSFTFHYVDPYGDETDFLVTTKDTGKVLVTLNGALGNNKILHADTWEDNGDGTMTTGPLDADLDVEFLESDGSIIWAVDGEEVVPVNYTEPTEFIEKTVKAPTNGAEAVGVYTFGFVNAYGVTVPYVLWLNADNTYDIFMVSAWVGTQKYSGTSWTVSEDSVAKLGPCTIYEGEPPKTDGNGAVWFSDDTYESSWVLGADGTAVPEGYDGDIGELDLSTLEADVYHPGAEAVGIYTFGFVNAYGVTVPYVLWINADGTADIYMVSAWVGTQSYKGANWVLNDDGTVTISDMSYDGEPPKTDGNGATWFADDTYESTWVLNDDHTCVPKDFDGDIGELDLTEIPDLYPMFQ